MLLVCHMRCPYCCFSSHFCFLVIFVLLMFVLSVLFHVTAISLTLHFFMKSSSCIDVSTLSWMLESLLPLFYLGTYSMSLLFLGCKALCIVMSFLVLWSICWSFSFILFFLFSFFPFLIFFSFKIFFFFS